MGLEQEISAYKQGYQAGYQKALADYHIIPNDPLIPNEILTLPLDHLGLSSRAVNCLHSAGCYCIGDACLLKESQILKIRNLGSKTSAEIAALIVGFGISHTAWTQFVSKNG